MDTLAVAGIVLKLLQMITCFAKLKKKLHFTSEMVIDRPAEMKFILHAYENWKKKKKNALRAIPELIWLRDKIKTHKFALISETVSHRVKLVEMTCI